MDKPTRRHMVAERLRRQGKAEAEARAIRVIRLSEYNAGRRQGRAEGTPLPRDFMDAIIRNVVSNLAREVGRRITEDQKKELAFIAVRVAERVLESAPWNPLDEAAMSFWTDEATTDLRLRFSIPALSWNEAVARRDIELLGVRHG